MNQLSILKNEMRFGHLIWIQPPSLGSSLFFARKLMNGAGFLDQEMIYLTARQFIRYSSNGFCSELLKSTRAVLIGDLENLGEKMKLELQKKLSQHQLYKQLHDLNLVLIAPASKEVGKIFHKKLKVSCFPVFCEKHPIEINEKIHEIIESASVKFSKPIWQLSEDAAEYLELSFLNYGEDFIRCLINRAVQGVQGKRLYKKDLVATREYPNLYTLKSRN